MIRLQSAWFVVAVHSRSESLLVSTAATRRRDAAQKIFDTCRRADGTTDVAAYENLAQRFREGTLRVQRIGLEWKATR